MTLEMLWIEISSEDDAAVDAARLPKKQRVPINPTKFSLNKQAQFAEIAIPGLETPLQQYVRGQSEKVTLELLIDADDLGAEAEGVGVKDRVEQLYQLVKIQPKTHAPPRIQATWGKALNFKAVVESVTREYTLFSPDGLPLRARVTLALREYNTLEDQIKQLNLQSNDHTRTTVVTRGETLSQIAAREYRDPARWRTIAEANDIDDPLRIQPGMQLKLPPVE